MYIWIFLATIMMMLSFYNLAPRADKENSIAEVKAATVVNRFRAESAAFMKAFECQAVLNIDPNGTGWKTKDQRYVVKSSADPNFGYTKFSDNLPIGYEADDSFEVSHMVLCLDKPINDPHVNAQTNDCTYSSESTPIYMFSIAAVPEQWISKSDPDSKQPAPELLQYISEANNGGITYGWINCSGEESLKCKLSGYHSRFADVEDTGETDENGNVVKKRMYKYIDEGSDLWSTLLQGELQNMCVANPCLFAFHRVPSADYKNMCKKTVCQSREDYEAPDCSAD